jgi:hypothetical protein
MMDTVQKYKLMPEEIFSKKNYLADNGTLAKELFYNIVYQTCLPAGITAVDADNATIASPMQLPHLSFRHWACLRRQGCPCAPQFRI